jgi:hypothetical protein
LEQWNTPALIYFAFGFLFFLNSDAITAMDGIIYPQEAARTTLGPHWAEWKLAWAYGLIVLLGSIGFTSLTRLYGIVLDGAGDMSNWHSNTWSPPFTFQSLITFTNC